MILMRILLALAAAIPLLAGCGGAGASDSAGPRVVASFYPLEYVAGRVAGEHADVVGLTAPGQEPHDLELTFKQTADVAEADLLVVSRGLQPAVDEAVDQSAAEHVVDAAEVADLLPPGESGAEHEAHADEEGHEHGAEDVDPHFWLDPTRLARVAAAVQDQLAEADPDHAAQYADNLAALQDDLTALDRDFQQGLASCARDTVVVSHDAFGYLGARYGLDLRPINGLSPDAEPSPAHLAELADLIESEGVTTVFSETLVSPELAESLAGDLGLETAVLDPIEGLSDQTEDEDYLSLMRANLDALQKANDCS
jgi:zinc transport system substrate-binding protein